MDTKRALLTGLASYAAIFLISSALMFLPMAYSWETMKWSLFGSILMMALASIVIFLLSQRYYFKTKPKDAIKEGLMLGAIIVAISFLIEIPLMVYGFAKTQGWLWYLQWNILAGYILALVLPVIAAKTKK